MATVDAVRVDHRDELEDKVLAEGDGAWVGRVEEEGEQAVEDVACGRLARVNTGGKEEDRLGRARLGAHAALARGRRERCRRELLKRSVRRVRYATRRRDGE